MIRRLACALFWHRPALVTSPCRCRRCGAMVAWDDRGGWRLDSPVRRARVNAAARRMLNTVVRSDEDY